MSASFVPLDAIRLAPPPPFLPPILLTPLLHFSSPPPPQSPPTSFRGVSWLRPCGVHVIFMLFGSLHTPHCLCCGTRFLAQVPGPVFLDKPSFAFVLGASAGPGTWTKSSVTVGGRRADGRGQALGTREPSVPPWALASRQSSSEDQASPHRLGLRPAAPAVVAAFMAAHVVCGHQRVKFQNLILVKS